MSSAKKISELKQKTITSTVQLISREIGMKIIAIVGQLILVRFLTPTIFGIFAIFSFLISIAEILNDIGFNLSIIQKKEKPTHQQLSTIFFIKLILTIIVI